MLVIDLKLALFVVLLGLIVVALAIWWLAEKRAAWLVVRPAWLRPPRKTTGWHVCERLPFGIVLTAPGGRIVFMNDAAQRLLSEREGAALAELQKALNRFADTSHPDTVERNGMIHHPLPVRWWRYLLADGNTLLVLFDGSDHQRFVRQQAFTSQLVHELRTPLTALVAHTEIARNLPTLEAARLASLDIIQAEAQRMGRLVRDMLELHRLETVEDLPLQACNLALIAEEAIAPIILHAEECGISITFEADTPLPLVLASPDRLKQVFANLLDNAVTYCRPRDTILVRLEAREDQVCCRVQDSGPGIAASDLPHVTERLYRGRSVAGATTRGNGIGLAVVTEILRHHHATLFMKSSTEAPSSGTSCQWSLPALPAPANQTAPALSSKVAH